MKEKQFAEHGPGRPVAARPWLRYVAKAFLAFMGVGFAMISGFALAKGQPDVQQAAMVLAAAAAALGAAL